jgi:hypothetical protein
MKFTNDAVVNGTSLKGHIVTTYAELVEKFGEPNSGSDKTTVEWRLDFADGTVATIYDWKYGETPMHKTEWNIGGKNSDAVFRVYETMGLMKEEV